MPVVANPNVLTLTQHAERLGPDHLIQTMVANLLAQQNGIIADAGWIESNLPLGHSGTVQVGLPQVFYTGYNQFVAATTGAYAAIMEAAARLEAYSQVDKRLADIGGPSEAAKLRVQEGQGKLESLNQGFTQGVFYGSRLNPLEVEGLSSRYNSLEAVNAQNIINAGGTASTNSSIWLVVWKPQAVTFFFPKGSKAGIMHEDLGVETLQSINTNVWSDGNPGLQRVYREHWEWLHGIFVHDWRYIVRICNIDIPTLLAKSGADLLDLMIRATHRIPVLNSGRPVFYMNRTLFEMVDIAKRDAVMEGGQLKYEVVDGILTPVFRGIPIRIVDQLLLTEAEVS